MTLPDDHDDEQKRETQKEPQVAKNVPCAATRCRTRTRGA